MIKITPEIRSYTLAIAGVGERMKQTANKFGAVSERFPKSVEEIQGMKDDYSMLLREFESQEEALIKLNAPSLLKVEHSKLNQSYNKYVVSTEKAISSLDVENIIVNAEMLDEAQKLQWEASKEIVEVSNEMARKLGI